MNLQGAVRFWQLPPAPQPELQQSPLEFMEFDLAEVNHQSTKALKQNLFDKESKMKNWLPPMNFKGRNALSWY